MQPAISNGHFSSPFRATTTILSPRAQAALSSSREQPTPTVAGVSCFRSASKGRRRRQQRIEINRAGCPWQTDLDLATTRTRCLPQRREDTEGPLGRVNHCRPSSRLSYRCVCGGVVKVLVGKATWMIADAPGYCCCTAACSVPATVVYSRAGGWLSHLPVAAAVGGFHRASLWKAEHMLLATPVHVIESY